MTELSIKGSGLRRQNSESGCQNPDYSQSKFFYLVFISLCSVFCVLFFSLKVQAGPGIPEKFVYNVYWAGIKAGTSYFEVKDTPVGVTITTRAESADFVSVFYKVRDVAQSILYSDGYPYSYIMKIREGHHRKHKVTSFGTKPENGPQEVIFNDKLKNRTKEYYLEKKAYDPVSGFYEIRKRSLKVGHSEYLDIFDSKKLWNVEVKVLRKERIKTPAGEFDTIVIKPLLQSEGIFIKKGEVHIWLTDDEKKIPVMVKSKVKVGSFKAKLAEGAY